MISADVNGLLVRPAGNVKARRGLPGPCAELGDEGLEPPPPLLPTPPERDLLDGERFSVFNPRALLIRLVGTIPTPLALAATVPMPPTPPSL